jgi:hypothetical protein
MLVDMPLLGPLYLRDDLAPVCFDKLSLVEADVVNVDLREAEVYEVLDVLAVNI